MILDFEVNEDQPGVGNDLIRILFSKLDFIAFSLMKFIYEIFLNVATAELFNNGTIRSFYGRVQLILGVFMLFRLSILIIEIIIDPDKASDKNTGFVSIIKRVAIGLILLAALTPINIPNPNPENDFERELNNNGLIFGVLYSLQNRILMNNTIGKIVLGVESTEDSNSTNTGNVNNYSQTMNTGNDLKSIANVFATSIVRVFVRINMLPVDKRQDDNMANSANWMCQINQGVLDTYTNPDGNPGDILNTYFLTTTCQNGNFQQIVNNVINQNLFYKSSARYAFVYIWPWCGVVGLIVTFIILGFTLDIAIRAIKLAILRLIAPVPIIAYMGPASKDNVAFSNWVKALITTYIDLFVRLAIIFFAIFLVNDIIIHGLPLQNNYSGGVIGGLTIIVIIIGIFVFAREAPKFIQEVLGIKSFGSNYGLSSLMGGTARLAGGGGLAGFATGALSTLDASTEAAAQGKAGPGVFGAWRQNSDTMAKIRTGDKEAHGGLLGRTMDRMDYLSRERNAGRHFAGNRDLADAEYTLGQYKNAARETAENYEMLKAQGAPDDQLREAYRKNEAMQRMVGKQEEKVKSMKEARHLYGVDPRASDLRKRRRGLGFVAYQANSAREDIQDTFKNILSDNTYRTPYKVTDDGPQAAREFDLENDNMIVQTGVDRQGRATFGARDIETEAARGIRDHDRDQEHFTGSMDGSTLGSMGSGGQGGGPGGGPNP